MMTVQDTLVLYNIYIISTNFNNPYHLQYIFIEIWVFTYIILIYSLIVNFCRDAVGVDLASLPHLAPQVSRADGSNLLQECASYDIYTLILVNFCWIGVVKTPRMSTCIYQMQCSNP